ncbi:hypothetical protein ACN4EG_08475 [Alkalinema pantanalense CENA528]|uniref:hypothetical protein n=1 Tax=Alkalinema pantanalense TaxID=1620705 RepID=UPI003D6F4861
MLGQSGYLARAYRRGLPRWAFSRYSRQALPRRCRSVSKKQAIEIDRVTVPKARSSPPIVPLPLSSDDPSATQDGEEEESTSSFFATV